MALNYEYPFNLTYQADRVLDSYDVTNRNQATFSSKYRMFFYWDGITDYDTHDCRVYYLGYMYGSEVRRASSIDIENDESNDFCLEFNSRTSFKTSSGKINSEQTFENNNYGFKAMNYFNTSAESDYTCDGYVFASLDSAKNFFENGDISGVIKFPSNINFVTKQLGFLDKTQTFIVNTKLSNVRFIKAQIVDELTIVDFSEIPTALLSTQNKEIDISNTINKREGTVIIPLNKQLLSSTGDLECEIILKDANGANILTTNTFVIRIKETKGGCDC